MKISGFAPILSTMFTDAMDIRRYQDVENEDGTTDTVMPLEPIYANVPCRVSFSSEDSPQDYEVDRVPIRVAPKIFCGPNIQIKAGDFVTVRRLNDIGEIIATYTGKLGLPSVYITHKEALFSIEESA